MILINLLPHREQKRIARRREFYVLSALSFAAAVLFVFAVGIVISNYISSQEERNRFISSENEKLDQQIKEIANLKQEIDALKARQQAVEDLQSDRNLPVHLLDELVKQVPEGVYLQSIAQDNLRVSMTGMAQSNERVSELLRNIGNNSAWLSKPELVEIKSAPAGRDNRDNQRLNQFTITAISNRPRQRNAALAPTAQEPPPPTVGRGR